MGNSCRANTSFKIMMTGIDSNVENLVWFFEENCEETLVTIGMTVRTFQYKKLLINNWYRDRISDKNYMMTHGGSYFKDNDGIIFVIDAGSQEEVDWFYKSQKSIFEDIARDEMYKNLPILIIANKQEKENAIKSNEIREKWNLNELLQGRTWVIMDSRSNSKEDVCKALDWMAAQMAKRIKING